MSSLRPLFIAKYRHLRPPKLRLQRAGGSAIVLAPLTTGPLAKVFGHVFYQPAKKLAPGDYSIMTIPSTGRLAPHRVTLRKASTSGAPRWRRSPKVTRATLRRGKWKHAYSRLGLTVAPRGTSKHLFALVEQTRPKAERTMLASVRQNAVHLSNGGKCSRGHGLGTSATQTLRIRLVDGAGRMSKPRTLTVRFTRIRR